MSDNTIAMSAARWRAELPTLTSRLVTLREPGVDDAPALVDVLSIDDASRFGLDQPLTEPHLRAFIERAARDRQAGTAFTYVIVTDSSKTIAGLVQVRGLDPQFETAEWECTLLPSARGCGVFVETARLVAAFVFESVGAHRLEARALLLSGRANGALRKLGAVQEGILRRSARRHGDYVDQVLWSVLRDDWTEHWLSTTAPRVH